MPSPKTKGRMINKDISNSKGFASLSPAAAVLFCMMIPHYDAHGKMNGGPGYIKEEVCPRISYLVIKNIPIYLKEISDKTSVKWFEHDGRYWIHSVNFLSDHQKLNPERIGQDLLPSYSRIDPPEVEVEVEVEVEGEGGEVGPREAGDLPPAAAGKSEGKTNEEYVRHIKEDYNRMIETPTETAQWRTFYNGALNVDELLFAACTWLVEHPSNRKTKLKQFYGNWLRKEFQDQAQRKMARSP